MDNENKPLSHREFAKQFPPLPPQGCCPADEEIARLEKEFFEQEKILSDGMLQPAGKARLSQNTAIPTSGLDYSDLPLFPDVLPCIVALQKAKASTEKKPG